jgi:hypothetical protein
VNGEQKLMEHWRVKLLLIAAIVSPTVTATGAYYTLDKRIDNNQSAAIQRVSELELQTSKSFVNKDEFKQFREDVKQVRDDQREMRDAIVEIKTLLKRSR